MRRPSPLPPEIACRPFSGRQAAELGVPTGRLRRADLNVASRGVRTPRTGPPDLASLVEVLQEVSPECASSHSTAARLWGMRLPRALESDPAVHLSTPHAREQLRRRGVVGHRQGLGPGESALRDGLRLRSRARTWLDLAPRLSVVDLVVAGDGLVCAHRHGVHAGRPAMSSVAELREVVAAHPGTRDIIRARAALERIRVGSDSRPETLLRLALEDAGMHGLVLDMALLGPDGFPEVQPDIAVPEHRLALQFEGAHHDTDFQRLRDIDRLRRTKAHGWTEVR